MNACDLDTLWDQGFLNKEELFKAHELNPADARVQACLHDGFQRNGQNLGGTLTKNKKELQAQIVDLAVGSDERPKLEAKLREVEAKLGNVGRKALDAAGVSDETAVATCPQCNKPITCTVTKRARQVQLGVDHFACGGWRRGSRLSKKGEPGFVSADLPGKWTLKWVKDNVYHVQGKHLERIGMCSDQPLYFTVQPKLSAKSSGTAKRSRGD